MDQVVEQLLRLIVGGTVDDALGVDNAVETAKGVESALLKGEQARGRFRSGGHTSILLGVHLSHKIVGTTFTVALLDRDGASPIPTKLFLYIWDIFSARNALFHGGLCHGARHLVMHFFIKGIGHQFTGRCHFHKHFHGCDQHLVCDAG